VAGGKDITGRQMEYSRGKRDEKKIEKKDIGMGEEGKGCSGMGEEGKGFKKKGGVMGKKSRQSAPVIFSGEKKEKEGCSLRGVPLGDAGK